MDVDVGVVVYVCVCVLLGGGRMGWACMREHSHTHIHEPTVNMFKNIRTYTCFSNLHS